MLAVVLSLAAAACFAASTMFIHRVPGEVGPLQLVRWQMGIALVLTAALALLFGGWQTIGATEALWLAASSALGIMFGSLAFIATIQLAGPRVSALLFTMSSPFAVALGFVVRGETVNLSQNAGVALIVIGIVLAVLGPAEGGRGTGRTVWLGVALGLLTALAQATGSLLARPAMLAGADPVAAMVVRSGAGYAFFVLLLAIPALRPARRPDPAALRLIGGSAVVGMVLGMSLLMAALAVGDVGIVTTLSSTIPVLILPMVWYTTSRAPGLAAWVGAALAVAGTALISLST